MEMKLSLMRCNKNPGIPCRIVCFSILSWHKLKLILQMLILGTLTILVYVLYQYPVSINMKYSNNIRNYSPSESNEFLAAQLRIDRSQYSEADILENAQKSFPNIPISFWMHNSNRSLYYKNDSCAKFPNVFNLQINNLYWQTLQTTNGIFYLYTAYYDKRQNNPTGPTVRILGMFDRTPHITTYCQMWFDNCTEPVIVKSEKYILMYNQAGLKIGPLYPYQTLCPVPKTFSGRVPIFVSLVERFCDTAPNCLRVTYRPLVNSSKKSSVAVCVKMLDFLHTDVSVQLVEWIELMGILKVDKIYIYSLEVHSNISKVLEYYQKREGKPEVEVTPFSLAGGQPNLPGFQHIYNYKFERQNVRTQVLSNNDCFYKSIYQHDYVLLIDTDEAVIPINEYTLPELMDAQARKVLAEKKSPTQFQAPMAFFRPKIHNLTDQLKDIPPYMYMLQHVDRDDFYGTTFRGFNRGKTFFDTEKVEAVKVHYPKKCLVPCSYYDMNFSDARTHHYRQSDYSGISDRDEAGVTFVQDTTLHKYKEPLIDRTLAVLNYLKFFGEE